MFIDRMAKDYLAILDYYCVPPSSDDANTLAQWAIDLSAGQKKYDIRELLDDIASGHDDFRIEDYAIPRKFHEIEEPE